MSDALPTRRAVLGSLVAAALGAPGLLAGCTAERSAPAPRPTPPPTPSPSPDEVLTARIVSAKLALLESYAAVFAAHPQQEARLQPLATDHRRHLAALGEPSSPASTAEPSAAIPRGTPEPTAASADGTPPPATPRTVATTVSPAPATPAPATPEPAPATPEPAPATPEEALAQLAERERDLARERLTDVVGVSARLARLVASIGGAEAVHAAALGRSLAMAPDTTPGGGG